jgi:hypothetical protein
LRYYPGTRLEGGRKTTKTLQSGRHYWSIMLRYIFYKKNIRARSGGGGGGLFSPVPFPELPKFPSNHRVRNMRLKPE